MALAGRSRRQRQGLGKATGWRRPPPRAGHPCWQAHAPALYILFHTNNPTIPHKRFHKTHKPITIPHKTHPPPHIFTAKYTSISTYRPTPFSFWVPYTPHHHYKSCLGYPSAPPTWGRVQTGLYSVPLLVILCSKYGGLAWIFLRNGL